MLNRKRLTEEDDSASARLALTVDRVVADIVRSALQHSDDPDEARELALGWLDEHPNEAATLANALRGDPDVVRAYVQAAVLLQAAERLDDAATGSADIDQHRVFGDSERSSSR